MRVILLVSSLACTVLMVMHAVRENITADWRSYQTYYVDTIRGLAENESERAAADRFEIKLRQVVLPEGARIDRCVTCHVGAEDPRLTKYPLPIAKHSGNYLETHEIDRFGCTLCHDGQGHAITFEDAASFRRERNWEKPILAAPFVEANCYRCHRTPLEETPTYNRGRELFLSRGCMGCHKVNGRGGYLGPDLTEIADASRHVKVPTPEHRGLLNRFNHNENLAYLYEAVRYPHAQPAGSLMPEMEFSDEETLALVVYLKSLGRAPGGVSLAPPGKPLVPPSDPVERGAGLYTTYCLGCHGEEGKGGIPNPNYIKETFPRLDLLAERLFLYEEEEVEIFVNFLRDGGRNLLTAAEPPDLPELADIQGQLEAIRNVIRVGNPAAALDVNGPEPIAMPSWQETLAEDEIDALIAYLTTAMPWDELDE